MSCVSALREPQPGVIIGSDASAPFNLLSALFGDPDMAAIWGEASTLSGWLRFEVALAAAQADLGVIPIEAAEQISSACRSDAIDTALLRERSRVVGYPILPLVEQLAHEGGALVSDYVHWGATTQDVMDTAVALQVSASIDLLESRLGVLGDLTAVLSERHRSTIMVARTHAQAAVPTTFGAKLAVYLAEFARHLERLHSCRERAAVVQMFGAGGTAAAYGEQSASLRTEVARRLGLRDCATPWHTARDSLAECIWTTSAITATLGKLAKEVIDLSRNEIGEVSEMSGPLRGASSTMPQKTNPITSEVLVGLAGAATAGVSTGLIFMQAGHERAAGEWQLEWSALPAAFNNGGTALLLAIELIGGLVVHPDAMEKNLRATNGLVMAEGAMMQLASHLGRFDAHELVYDCCSEAKAAGTEFESVLAKRLEARSVEGLTIDLDASHHLGETAEIVMASIELWRNTRANGATS